MTLVDFCSHTMSPAETWLGASSASFEMCLLLPQWGQTPIRLTQALNQWSHGPILWGRHTKGLDWLVLDQSTTNHLPIGQTQKEPFPTGMSNNSESNIQVTHPSCHSTASVCVVGGVEPLLSYMNTVFDVDLCCAFYLCLIHSHFSFGHMWSPGSVTQDTGLQR